MSHCVVEAGLELTEIATCFWDLVLLTRDSIRGLVHAGLYPQPSEHCSKQSLFPKHKEKTWDHSVGQFFLLLLGVPEKNDSVLHAKLSGPTGVNHLGCGPIHQDPTLDKMHWTHQDPSENRSVGRHQ